ncbi:MAG: hypothetical protein HC815_38190 [Richelia sp. RM1_1_1]|nr:hypothetical protein [Richelia sp. RM1_1_1]
MTKTVIHTVLGINNCTLLVFYTNACCWQFRVISCNGSVYGERKIYYTARAAETAGRKWVVKR